MEENKPKTKAGRPKRSTKKALATVKNTPKALLPKKMVERLQEKMMTRNEDLILDKMEEIEVHKKAIFRLQNEIKELAGVNYLSNE